MKTILDLNPHQVTSVFYPLKKLAESQTSIITNVEVEMVMHPINLNSLLVENLSKDNLPEGVSLETKNYSTVHFVPKRPDIKVYKTPSITIEEVKEQFSSLIKIDMKNQAITSLLEVINKLEQPEDSKDIVYIDSLGVGRYVIVPNLTVRDVNDYDVLTTDLVSVVEEVIQTMLKESGYSNASEYLSKQKGIKPIVNILVGLELKEDLSMQIEDSTLKSQFDVRVLSTFSINLGGKIIVTFDPNFDYEHCDVNPLSFGNLVYNEFEIVEEPHSFVISPSYCFVNHCPVVGLIKVKV